jgi:hypothetical protein
VVGPSIASCIGIWAAKKCLPAGCPNCSLESRKISMCNCVEL